MDTIGQLNIIQKLWQLNENLVLWLAENSDGQACEVLTIEPNSGYKTLLDRLLRNEILPLSGQEIEGIQKIIQSGFDAENNKYYVVYEHLENLYPISNPTLYALKSLLKGLDILKKQNRFAFVISDVTVVVSPREAKLRFVGLFELFKQQGLLNERFLAPELQKNTRPSFQSDIYSVFVCFSDIASYTNDAILKEIFEKSLSEDRKCRYSKYSDILDDLEKVNILATTTRDSAQPAIRVVVRVEDYEQFRQTLVEMNNSCHFLLDRKLSENKAEITGQFSTKSYSGRFFVDKSNYIFIPVQHIKNQWNNKVLQQGFPSEYGFDYNPTRYFDSYSYFFEKWEQLNTISELNHTKQNLLKKWQLLPDQEREYVEERAFKANYIDRTESKNNPANIRFTLVNEFRNWEALKDLKQNEVNLSIDDKIIGQIQDYNPTDCLLVIKDARITVDEIPVTGELLQDVRMQTSQFKKQVEACKKFESNEIVNPELCGILATPERVPQSNRVEINYESFKEKVIDVNIKTDDTQREAVLEALHYKPVYLIQGPPGTGKTTVIVELIQQLLIQNENAKILVTSQSNLAVDNVLEKLPDHILFMRLAADDEKISGDLKKHSFQNKLKYWVKSTQDNSTEFFNQYFQDKVKDKAIVNFYKFYISINKRSFDNFRNLLRMQGQYIRVLFENARNFNDVESIFIDKLGKEFLQLKNIQQDWFAFLSNADTDDGEKKRSTLNDGTNEVDFRTAFVKSVNVIGATCIHIASSQYSKINFRFDYVIMDESGKASPAETLVPINMGHNIILIGDHKQLPPVITREDAVKQRVKDKMEDNGLDIEKEFGESLFEKLITEFEANPNLHSYIKMLDIQYRMPRQIGNLISRFFYSGKLKNPLPTVLPNFDLDKFHQLKLKRSVVSIFDSQLNKEIEVPNSIIFVSTSKQEMRFDNDNKFDRKNLCNKNNIVKILEKLNELYVGNMSRKKPFTIGVIAGYRGQVNLLKDSIDLLQFKNFVSIDDDDKPKPLIEINTVDKFQGAERDIIIYDIVKSSMGSSPIGFLDDYRRINVAFSRVKRLLIIVGDSEYLFRRATLNPNGRFKEFKLKEIGMELERQGVITHDFNDIIS